MKKKSILCLIIAFIMLFVFENTDAAYVWEYGGPWDIDRKEYKTTYCTFSMSTSSVKIKININSDTEKLGWVYKHTDGNNDYFCLNMGLGGNVTYSMIDDVRVGEKTYTKYDSKHGKTYSWSPETQVAMARVVHWYLENRAKKNSFMYAQTAIWYIAENNLTDIDGDALTEVIKDTLLTSSCKKVERALKQQFKNSYFSCDCITLNYTTAEFERKCKDKFTEADRTSIYARQRNDALPPTTDDGITIMPKMTKNNSYIDEDGKYRRITLDVYKTAFRNLPAEYKSMAEDGSSVKTMVDSIVSHLHNSNYDLPILYFFEATSNQSENQTLIGLWGCKTSRSSCSSDITKLKSDYSNVNQRNRSTINYWNRLKKIQTDYSSAIPAWKLEIDEFVANPYCGKSCQADVDFYKTLRDSGSPNTERFWNEISSMYSLTDRDNPTCSNTTCEEDVEIYKNLKTTNLDLAEQKFLEIIGKWGDLFNKNRDNPKCEPSDTPPKCDYEIALGTCTFTPTVTGFEIKDTQVEDCWKKYNIAYNSDTLEEKSKWEEASNEFCDVYCYEEFKSELPGGITNIKAGQEFFWGFDQSNGYFGSISANRKCYTTGIKYDDFYKEFIINEVFIIQTYNKIVAKRKFNAQQAETGGACPRKRHDACVDLPTEYGTTEDCTNWCSQDTLSFCAACTDDAKAIPGSLCSNCNIISHNCCGTYSSGSTTRYSSECDKCEDGYNYSNGECYEITDGVTCKKSTLTFNSNEILESNLVYNLNIIAPELQITVESMEGSQEEISKCYDPGTVCNSTTVNGEIVVAYSEEETYLATLLLKRKELITKITSCQSNEYVNENNIYDYQTKVTLTYQDPSDKTNNRNISGDVLFKRQDSRSFSMTQGELWGPIMLGCAKLYVDNDPNNVENVNTELYRCNGDYTITIPRYSEYTWNFDGQWDYYYDEEYFTWNYLIENGLAYNIRSSSSYIESFIHNGKLGFIAGWNLRTNFYSFGEVNVSTFGNYYKGKGHFDDLFKENNNGDDVFKYSCPFEIENEFYGSECRYDCDYSTLECKVTYDSPEYCDEIVTGIDVVYRVIELNKDTTVSFPGIVGTGRSLGTNWSTFVNNRNEKFANIMNYKNIYEKEPIYSIDLTPALIQKIRADNAEYRKHNMDPYTTMKDKNKNKKYTCVTGDSTEDTTCASKWLTELSQDGVLTGIYGSITDTDNRLAKIREDKRSNAASGNKAVAGGA